MIDGELLREAVKWGPGYFLSVVMFAVWIYEKRSNEKSLVGIIRERKGDRDTLLTLMGRIEGHLARTDAFEVFAKETLAGAERVTPKRRLLDRALAEALAKASSEEGQ